MCAYYTYGQHWPGESLHASISSTIPSCLEVIHHTIMIRVDRSCHRASSASIMLACLKFGDSGRQSDFLILVNGGAIKVTCDFLVLPEGVNRLGLWLGFVDVFVFDSKSENRDRAAEG